MDLTQLANLGEFIGGVAVLVTLVYLAVQVRQGNANTRASARQNLIENWSQIQFDLGHHPELLRILGEGFSNYQALPDSDQVQFDFLMSRYVSNVYNGVLLHRDGMLDRDTLDQIGRYIASVAVDAKVWWERWPQPPEVEEYVKDYRRRHSGPIPKLRETFPHWVPLHELASHRSGGGSRRRRASHSNSEGFWCSRRRGTPFRGGGGSSRPRLAPGHPCPCAYTPRPRMGRAASSVLKAVRASESRSRTRGRASKVLQSRRP